MSRGRSRAHPHLIVVTRSGAEPTANERASVAEYVGKTSLELAKLAQAQGFATLGYLLESAALEAGAEAAARGQPAETPES
jgi:hypothetical protein